MMEVIKRIPKTKEKNETKEKPHYRIRLNKTHDSNIRFATLIHELAHLYLGHLGEDDYLKIPDRSGLTHEYKELEAESVCYMICRCNGVEPDSNRYLAGYVCQDMTIDHFDLYALLNSAGQIETVLDLAAHNQF